MTSTAWAAAIVALIIGLVGGYMYGSSNAAPAAPTSGTQSTLSAEKEVALYSAMRKLWSDHVWYTREYVTTFAAGNKPASDAAATRLLKNQEDIGGAVASYYGKDAGDQLTTLLKTHITQAVTLLADAKAGKNDAVNADKTAWQQNADQVAAFLAQANPNWPEATLKSMMQTHLTTTLGEATAELKGDYSGSVAAFDKVFAHINMMSDALASGIVAQFPDKFK